MINIRKVEKEGAEVEPFITLLSELGFPVVVTLYLLHRMEAKLDVVIQSIQSLPERLQGKW